MTKSAPWELARRSTFKAGLSRAIVLVCLSLAAATAARAEPPERVLPSRLNAARLRWFEYKLVAGRILATSAYPEGMNISFGPSTTDTRRREHLQLLILADRASIRYQLRGDGETLSIELAESGEFSIRRTRGQPPLELSFVQPPDGPLSLVVKQGATTREIRGPSFWHLYLAAPELVAQELVPELEILRPAWQLVAAGEQLERNLIQRAQQPAGGRGAQWRLQVEKLGSTNFAEREKAQHELAANGQAVLPFLEELAPDQLDPEQAERVRKLIANLRVNYEDTPDRVANWLIGDVAVWLAIAERAELSKRELAIKQLRILLNADVEFDPAADEAVREVQLAKLRRQWLPMQASPPAAGASVPPPALER